MFQELLHGGFREWQEEKEEEREVQREVFHKPLDKTEGEKEWKKDNDGVPRSREELLEAFFAPEEPEEKRLVWDMTVSYTHLDSPLACGHINSATVLRKE